MRRWGHWLSLQHVAVLFVSMHALACADVEEHPHEDTDPPIEIGAATSPPDAAREDAYTPAPESFTNADGEGASAAPESDSSSSSPYDSLDAASSTQNVRDADASDAQSETATAT